MAALQPQLAAIVADFERQQRRLHALVDGMPDARWSSRADPTRWSVAECVAHLNLTSEAYLPVLRAALAGAPAANGARPSSTRYRRDPIGWLISVAAGPLPSLGGRRLGGVRAPASFVPGGDLPRAAVMATFDRLQAEQIAIAREADGAPLNDIRIKSPFDARVRYNMYAALYTLPRHQHRHIDQAEAAVS